MKLFKPLLISFALNVFATQVLYANPILNRHNMLPNNIPEVIQFKVDQKEAEIFFQKTSLPAQFHCYFAPPNNQEYKGITAHFSSDTAIITDQLGKGNILKGGTTDVELFSVLSMAGNRNLGSVKISLEGDIKTPTVTIMCAMHR